VNKFATDLRANIHIIIFEANLLSNRNIKY